MNFNLKEMYSYLLSHTFPGMLFLFEILLFLHATVRSNIFHLLLNKDYLVVLILVGYAVSTLLGTMLDGVQHCVFDIFVDPIRGKKGGLTDKERAKKKFDVIFNDKSGKGMKVYKHFVEDDFYYPYEAYANISVTMAFGLILFLCVALKSCLGFWWGPVVLFFIILRALIHEALVTYGLYLDEEEQFLDVLESKLENSKENG